MGLEMKGLGGDPSEPISPKNMNFCCKISKSRYSMNFKFLFEVRLDMGRWKVGTEEMGRCKTPSLDTKAYNSSFNNPSLTKSLKL